MSIDEVDLGRDDNLTADRKLDKIVTMIVDSSAIDCASENPPVGQLHKARAQYFGPTSGMIRDYAQEE